ncbi:hypothetical protein ACSBL2_08035 [Pedobacter sp. AW31-3R]|uniref:hypothetical protein n=1 Tax=Pedobacter sp. AW31-3R TaxID=3445781 RepID=UPI003F9FAE86
MAIVKYSASDLIPITLNILSLSVMTFAEYGFKSALEGELKDIKPLVGTEITDGSAFELLDGLEDEVSKFVIRAIIKIDDYITTFRLMHNIDLEELFEDKRIQMLADDIYFDLFSHAEALAKVNIRGAMEELPLTVANAFFYLCKMMIHQEMDTDSYMEKGLHVNGWKEFEFLDTSDRNVAVLYDLVNEMLILHEEIGNIYANMDKNSLPGTG